MKRIEFAGKDTFPKRCDECGVAYEAGTAKSRFCCPAHRNAYDFRRQERGKILYDFFMQMRYRRLGAKGLWSVMCRLAEEWHAEDKERPGLRQSWNDPAAYVEKRPYLVGKRGRV